MTERMTRLLRLSPSAAVKEKRLATLLGGRDAADPLLRESIDDAQLLASLELAGFSFTWDQVRSSRADARAPAPIVWLRRAQTAVDQQAPFGVAALLAWHGAATGTAGAFRATECRREGGPPPAPAQFVASRVAILEQWLGVESSRELKPAQLGALALARIVEIRPFDDANGRVARLAASHLMVRAGSRPPILLKADAPRLVDSLQAAFQLVTEPLTTLLEEASERALDVAIQTLEAQR